jgi:catechol 2,3-dioxygenase-like lactoylglutathione lyase family enzyme
MARLVGINHVALEVGDIERALEFYGSLFEISLRGRGPSMAFIDMGDQFIALSRGREQPPDDDRHFGLVVDDREAVRAALREQGGRRRPRGLGRLLRPLGEPHPGRRLPRHPVREDPRRAARGRRRAPRQALGGAAGDGVEGAAGGLAVLLGPTLRRRGAPGEGASFHRPPRAPE